MIHVEPIPIDEKIAMGISVKLHQTNLLTISAPHGYIMCGLIDIERLDELHPEREVVAARVTGVRTFEDMLAQKVDAVSKAAQTRGICLGMNGKEALSKMF